MDTTGKALVIFGFFFFIGMFSLMWVSLAAGILFILIVGFSAVPATLAIYSHQENKQKEKKLVKHQDGKLVKPDGRFAAQYLGGYALYPQPKHLMIFSYPDHLEVPELRLTIPYNQLLNVQSLTKEAITAGRMFLVGWYALALKKRYVYLALTFKDAIGIEQNAVFDLYSGHNISVVQPFLYRKMVNARKGQRESEGT